MSKTIYKVFVLDHLARGSRDTIRIQPNSESLEDFKEEIFVRFPELRDAALIIFYEDAEYDEVTIYNGSDFGIFKQLCIMKVFVRKTRVEAVQAPNVAPAASKQNVPDSIGAMHHTDYKCNGCNGDIFGFRYVCLECTDFNLCMNCGDKMHPHHILVRISKPSDAKICERLKVRRRRQRRHRDHSQQIVPGKTKTAASTPQTHAADEAAAQIDSYQSDSSITECVDHDGKELSSVYDWTLVARSDIANRLEMLSKKGIRHVQIKLN